MDNGGKQPLTSESESQSSHAGFPCITFNFFNIAIEGGREAFPVSCHDLLRKLCDKKTICPCFAYILSEL